MELFCAVCVFVSVVVDLRWYLVSVIAEVCAKLLAVRYYGFALVHWQRCKGVPVSNSVINSVNNGIDMMK